MQTLKIYKIRFLDIMGHEVAEFGFYESKRDAERRWHEVQDKINMPGSLDIREISVNRSSYKLAAQYGLEKLEKPKGETDEQQ